MRCSEIQQKLDLFATQELALSVRERIEGHLVSCEDCRKALAKLRRFKDLLMASPAPPVPDGFAARVVAQAKERQAVVTRQGRMPHRPLGSVWKRLEVSAGIAAALATGLLVGLFMGHETWQVAAHHAQAPAAQAVDPLAASGFEYLVEPGGDSLAQAYLGLTVTSDR
ncbi:MAG: zf-HC2 domain-containing protein [Planctomycetes bacterium]|nr:zf-HC2 domain-containing protein [Planctomycetota bacterium]MBL7044188.1 zf-HC2 domain-containing protein [Pirellulaceae bacterium]